jgi:hypothetical protein
MQWYDDEKQGNTKVKREIRLTCLGKRGHLNSALRSAVTKTWLLNKSWGG